MNLDDIKNLKYYIVYGVLVIGFFTYSGVVGRKWFNPTSIQKEKGERTGHRSHGGFYRYYHK
jgi:hypothetical protein